MAQFQKDGAFGDLRAVFSLHPGAVHGAGAQGSEHHQVRGLQGQALQRRQPGLGHARVDGGLLAAMGWKMSDFALASELRPTSTARRCATARSTASSTASATRRPTSRTRPRPAAPSWFADRPGVDKLVKAKPYYANATIPGGLYPNNPNPTQTYGVLATVVSSAKVPADVVYNVVKAVFDNFDEFKKLHPALANLKPEDMVKDGLSAPLHEGAVRYYKEKGWIK
jgi:TRAP transporter TAXI family solute receptor